MTLIENPAELERAYDLVPEGFSMEGWKDVAIDGNESPMIRAVIPTDHVAHEDIPLDEVNVEKVEALIQSDKAQGRGLNGQLVPGLLGIVPEMGEPNEWLRAVDTFHRLDIQRRNGGLLLAKVFPQMSFVELVKERIDHTGNHGTIEMSRAILWANQLWEKIGQPETMTVIDAFRAYSGNPTARCSDLQNQEAATWVETYTSSWKISPDKLLHFLTTTEGMPTSVTSLIVKGRGFTTAKAKIVAEFFPGDEDFQLFAAQKIAEHGFSENRTRSFVDELSRATSLGEAEAEFNNFLRYSTSSGQRSGSRGGRSSAGSTAGLGLPRTRTVTELITELDQRLAELGHVTDDNVKKILFSLGERMINIAGGEVERIELTIKDATTQFILYGEEGQIVDVPVPMNRKDVFGMREAMRAITRDNSATSTDVIGRMAEVNREIADFNKSNH